MKNHIVKNKPTRIPLQSLTLTKSIESVSFKPSSLYQRCAKSQVSSQVRLSGSDYGIETARFESEDWKYKYEQELLISDYLRAEITRIENNHEEEKIRTQRLQNEILDLALKQQNKTIENLQKKIRTLEEEKLSMMNSSKPQVLAPKDSNKISIDQKRSNEEKEEIYPTHYQEYGNLIQENRDLLSKIEILETQLSETNQFNQMTIKNYQDEIKSLNRIINQIEIPDDRNSKDIDEKYQILIQNHSKLGEEYESLKEKFNELLREMMMTNFGRNNNETKVIPDNSGNCNQVILNKELNSLAKDFNNTIVKQI